MTARLYSSHEVARASGASFRQIDYWERTGRLICTVNFRGSGGRRQFTALEVLIAALFVRIPLGASDLPERVAAVVRDNPTIATVLVPYGDDPAIGVYVDVAEIRSDLALDGKAVVA
jgi:hypothetical protein